MNFHGLYDVFDYDLYNNLDYTDLDASDLDCENNDDSINTEGTMITMMIIWFNNYERMTYDLPSIFRIYIIWDTMHCVGAKCIIFVETEYWLSSPVQ